MGNAIAVVLIVLFSADTTSCAETCAPSSTGSPSFPPKIHIDNKRRWRCLTSCTTWGFSVSKLRPTFRLN
jgi:hypothetical protein